MWSQVGPCAREPAVSRGASRSCSAVVEARPPNPEPLLTRAGGSKAMRVGRAYPSSKRGRARSRRGRRPSRSFGVRHASIHSPLRRAPAGPWPSPDRRADATRSRPRKHRHVAPRVLDADATVSYVNGGAVAGFEDSSAGTGRPSSGLGIIAIGSGTKDSDTSSEDWNCVVLGRCVELAGLRIRSGGGRRVGARPGTCDFERFVAFSRSLSRVSLLMMRPPSPSTGSAWTHAGTALAPS